MITPPETTACFYSAHFEKSAAQFMIGLLAESFSRVDDVAQVLITSVDFSSDVQATVELQEGLDEVSANIVLDDDEIEFYTKFNPIYLPNTINLLDVAELDDQGDVVSIDGFASPFVTMMITVSTDEMAHIIEGKVSYKQFDLPPIHVSLDANRETVLS